MHQHNLTDIADCVKCKLINVSGSKHIFKIMAMNFNFPVLNNRTLNRNSFLTGAMCDTVNEDAIFWPTTDFIFNDKLVIFL